MNEDGTLSFETDRFSVYAIAEDDKAEEFTGINIDASGDLKIGENVCNDKYYRVFGSGSTTSYICLGDTKPACLSLREENEVDNQQSMAQGLIETALSGYLLYP